MKIKVNIPRFGEKYCSDNVEFFLYRNYSGLSEYCFYKKGTNIYHNEYGPALENFSGYTAYFINNKRHRLSGYAHTYKTYNVIGRYAGNTKKEFMQNLANILIPINKN